MRIHKIIDKSIRHIGDGLQVSGGLTASIAANINEPGSTTVNTVSSHQGVVQKGGKTQVVQVEPESSPLDEKGQEVES